MKKFVVKLFASLLALTTAATVLTLPVSAAETGSWKKDGTGWWYSYTSGSYAKNGWAQIGGRWYYFTPSGYMKTGWVQDKGGWYFLGSDGAMQTGWIWDGGKSYYANASGKIYQDASQIINGTVYTFDASGAKVEDDGTGAQRMFFTKDHIDLDINSTGIFLSQYEALENIHDGEGVYSSADEGVVRFDNYKMVPVKAGITTVTCTYTTGAGKVFVDTIEVQVWGEKTEPTAKTPITAEGVFEKINAYREENGLNSLTYDNSLQAGADIRAEEYMAESAGERTAHTRPDGSRSYTAYGSKYRYTLWEAAASTIFDDLDSSITGWQKSSQHNAILLNREVTKGSVGVYKDPETNTVYYIFAAIK